MQYTRGLPLDPSLTFRGGSSEWATRSVLDYWRWGASNLLNNTSRGRLAEFIVARAVDAVGDLANEWQSFDLQTPSGVKIEVKSAAYIQDWGPELHRSRIAWSIKPTQLWDEITAKYVGDATHHADLYVFALFGTPEQRREDADPLDLTQWSFYVVRTDALPAAKSISHQRVAALSAVLDVVDLRAAVEAAGSQ